MPGEAKRVRYSDLVARIQEGTITDGEARRYFTEDRARSEPFKPALALNEDAIDISGVEQTARGSASLLGFDASRAVREGRHRSLRAGVRGGATILAEGDSWFNLPAIYPRTMIDYLQAKHSITNLAMWGDELAGMVRDGEYLPHLAGRSIDYFLFSGGGNDVLGGGELYRFLRLYDIDHSRPEDAAYYPTRSFYDALDLVEGLYRQLAQTVSRVSPGTKLVLHGYDCAIPQVAGAHLGQPMARQGLDPVHNAALCRAIIRFMIARLNERLDWVKRDFANVIHVNFMGTLRQNEWFDELHPREQGARKLADKMSAALGLRTAPERILAGSGRVSASSKRTPARGAGKAGTRRTA
jgi:hypothetical protein